MEALEDLYMYIDKLSMEQVLRNVISYAFKYTPCGGTVTMKIKRKLPQTLSPSGRTAFNPLCDNSKTENIQTEHTHKHKDVFSFKNKNVIDNDITYVLEEERLCIQIIDNETVSNKVLNICMYILNICTNVYKDLSIYMYFLYVALDILINIMIIELNIY